jgi:hypothetical protein
MITKAKTAKIAANNALIPRRKFTIHDKTVGPRMMSFLNALAIFTLAV